jgi:hypothetical protein
MRDQRGQCVGCHKKITTKSAVLKTAKLQVPGSPPHEKLFLAFCKPCGSSLNHLDKKEIMKSVVDGFEWELRHPQNHSTEEDKQRHRVRFNGLEIKSIA